MSTSRQQQQQGQRCCYYCSFGTVCNSYCVIFCIMLTTIVIGYSRYIIYHDDYDLGEQTSIQQHTMNALFHDSSSSSIRSSSANNNVSLQILNEHNHRNKHLPHQQQKGNASINHKDQQQQHDNHTVVKSSNSSSPLVTKMSSKKKKKKQQSKTFYYNILAYGDSLTDGMITARDTSRSPYAPYLQEALRTLRTENISSQSTLKDRNNDVSVYHRGNPGWTATDMLQSLKDPDLGLQTFVEQHTQQQHQQQDYTNTSNNLKTNYTIVILLVGTNDLAYNQDIDTISNEIQQLHTNCLELYNVNTTIVLSIPSSGYQYQNDIVHTNAIKINNQLQQYCNNSQKETQKQKQKKNSNNNKKTSYYIEFPIDYIPDSTNWSTDTLHLSTIGYQLLGKLLAPLINNILIEISTKQ